MEEIRSKCYALVKKIPEGYVTSYGVVGQILHCSPRLVGRLMSQNVYDDVPCHRVVKSDRTLGGFNGKDRSVKLELLQNEGVDIKENKIAREHYLDYDAIMQYL